MQYSPVKTLALFFIPDYTKDTLRTNTKGETLGSDCMKNPVALCIMFFSWHYIVNITTYHSELKQIEMASA